MTKKSCFEGSFLLICFQQLSFTNVATRLCLWIKQSKHHRFAKFDPLVLKFNLLKFLKFTADRDQTVSRRSEPSSCTTLVGEQPNPWNLLQLQDVISRHRGAKRSRRYDLSETISLLSPAYLLFVERWFFHTKSPDHYDRPINRSLLDMSILQSSNHMPLRSTIQ
jgi:hypothetical protein